MDALCFKRKKDTLLDSYRIVKGDMRKMDGNIRKLFLRISETAYGFTGITQRVSEVQQYIPDIIIERPTIEDIMLGNIEGGKE